MIRIKSKEKCCGCYACFNVCPQKCITMDIDNEGFVYPKININQCVDCGLCEKSCPVYSQSLIYSNQLEGYIGYAYDQSIRENSSSGGIFSLIAKTILNENGIVCGAAFDENFMVKHIIIESEKELFLLRGSKYVQSEIGDIYIKIKKTLNENKKVLFSGTPCQISGLKKYLNKEYENLFLVDILCHGVPSPKVWEKYIKEREKDANSKIIKVNFRDKSLGWNNFSLNIKFVNNKIYSKNVLDDYFLKFFLKHLSLRPSCHSCSFKSLERCSDITIGDAWGVEKLESNINTYNGVSLILLHTEKGRKMFEIIKNSIFSKEVSVEDILPKSADSRKSVKKHRNRKKFFKNLDKKSIIELDKYTKTNIVVRILKKIKQKMR